MRPASRAKMTASRSRMRAKTRVKKPVKIQATRAKTLTNRVKNPATRVKNRARNPAKSLVNPESQEKRTNKTLPRKVTLRAANAPVTSRKPLPAKNLPRKETGNARKKGPSPIWIRKPTRKAARKWKNAVKMERKPAPSPKMAQKAKAKPPRT